jgi:hypothetical protein
MSDAPITPPTQDTQSSIARVLDLVRRLIDYGRELAATLAQSSVTPDLGATARAFGTRDIRLILARITLGLLRANALEARLVQCAEHPESAPAARGAPTERVGPGVRPEDRQRTAAAPATQRTGAARLDLTHLPTPEQIAAEVRRRPIGTVIADICRDLGIMADHPLWQKLNWAILRHGGSLVPLYKDIMQRASQSWHAATAAVSPAPVPPILAPAGTGPP